MKSLRHPYGIIILAFLRVVIGVTFSCDYGWLLYGSRCYWRSVGEISGNNARGACRLRGAFLASVMDSGVQAFLQSRVMSAGDAWIGGTDESHEGTWVWLFGDDPFKYNNWNSGEPNNKNGNEDCLQFYHDKGNKWNDLPCDHKINGYICMKGGVFCNRCESGWMYHNNSCYTMYQKFYNFNKSRTYCKIKGGALASIPDDNVQTFLQTHVMAGGDVWVGGSDGDVEGSWVWMDSEDGFNIRKWSPGEPNNNNNEDCLALLHEQSNDNWNDQGCDKTQHGFICMKPADIRPSLSSSCACRGSNCVIGSAVDQRKCTKTDILFLIDDSASVFNAGFTYAKSVAKKLVDCLTIGQYETRVALMTFGSTVSTRFNFGSHTDHATVKSAIAGTPFRGEGRTDIANALNEARNMMGSNPTDTLDIVIVLTDGKSNTAVYSASAAIHTANVYVFAMGIGNDEDSPNLQTIARNPNADYHVVSNDYFDLHAKVSKLITGLCIGYTVPEFVTCEMEIRDSNGEKAQSPTIGSSQCLNQQDFYGKYQPEHIDTHLMISAQYTKYSPSTSHSDFHFGVLTAGVEILKRTKTGLDVNIQYSPVKVTSKYEPHITKDVKLTNSVILLDSERLCLKYDAYAGGYITFESKSYHYGTTTAQRTLCYFYDDQAPRHCSDFGTCTYSPLQLAVEITNASTLFVSFPGWEDIDIAGTTSIFASGISHLEITLHEMEYSNGTLNMKHNSKIPKTVCHNCSNTVIDIPHTNDPILYGVAVEVVDVALNPRQARRFVLYDTSSKIKVHKNYVLQVISASAKTNFLWQTNHGILCYNWTNRYYNDKFVHYNPLSPIATGVHNHFTGVYEQTTGKFPVTGTLNIHGITSFRYTIQKDMVDIISDQLTPNFPEENICVPISGVSDGNTITFKISANDIIGHQIEETVVHHIDSSPPEISDAWLVRDGTKEIFVHNMKDLSAMTLQFKAFDVHSGLVSVHWSIRNEEDHSVFGNGALGVYSIANCSIELNCYCPSVGECQLMNYTLVMNSLVVNDTHIGDHHRKYVIELEVVNHAALRTTESVTILVDESAPETGVVREGSQDSSDIDYISEPNITINWDGFIDHESGIKFYRLGLSNSCLSLEELWHPSSSNFEYYDTEDLSINVLITFEKKMYSSVIAFNNAMEPSNVECSDGFLVDITPPVISNLSVRNLKTIPSIGCINNSFWYVSEDLRSTRVTCNKTCFLNQSTPLLHALPETRMKSVPGDICVLPSLRNEYLYLGNDFLDISWNISDAESQIEDVFVGIGSSTSSVVSPDVSGYTKTHHNAFYRLRHPGLAGSSIVFLFVKAVNKASKETVMSVGPVIIDETPPLCINKPTTELANGLVVASWSSDDFEDNEQIGIIRKIYYRLVSKDSKVMTDFKEWTNRSFCSIGRYCITFPVIEIQHLDKGSRRVYEIEFHAFNNAGHVCHIRSNEFSLPSQYLPTRGTVYDVENIPSTHDENVEDIDVSLTLDSYCVYSRGIQHIESLTYEIGVGLNHESDDVISLHSVNGSFSNKGVFICENTSILQPYQKYFVLLKASSSGGSITLSSDGFVKINKNDFDHFIKIYDGPGCTSTNLVSQENLVLNGTNFILSTSLPLVVGSVYTAFVDVSDDTFTINEEEDSVISKSYNSFTFMPHSHMPVFIISVSLTDLKSNVVDLFRCEEDVDVQDKFTDIGAKLLINSTLDHHISHYELSLLSCGNSMNGVCKSVISKRVGKQKHYVFTEVHNILTEGYYKILLCVCFRRKCILGRYSDGFYLESNDPEFGYFSAELDSKSEECVDIQLHFQKFHCSYPLDTFAKFYRWAIFTDGDTDGSIQLTDYKIHVNNTGEIRSCTSIPVHPHRILRACLEGYCRSGRVSKTCTPINVLQNPNVYNKGVVYDLDARSEFFSVLDMYKYTRNIGNKLKDLHANEINYVAHFFKPGAFVVGLGKTENVWSITKSDQVPLHCENDDKCLVSKRETGGLVEISSKLPMEYNTLYYICVNITADRSMSRCSNGFIIDQDPPSKGEVYVKTKKNGFMTDKNRIDIHWHRFIDNNPFMKLGYPSSIQFFEIGIGTKRENDDESVFESVGLTSAVSLFNLSLIGGTSYYFSIKAHDHAGNFIVGSTKPYIFDDTPPTLGDVYVGHYLNHKSYVNPSTLLVNCIGSYDYESGLEKFEIGVGSTTESADVYPLFEHHYTNTPIRVPAQETLFDGHVYHIIVRVWNFAGLYTSGFSYPYVFDSSPPDEGIVRDGPAVRQNDEDYTTESTISVHWTEFVDKHSPIDFYRIGLGSGVKLTDIHSFILIGKKREWTWTLPLIPGKRYFSTVESCNMAGLCSQSSSNGIVIDPSPPAPGFVSIGAENVKYIPQRSFLSLEWGNFADVQSGIVHYEICVGTSKLNCNIFQWKNVRLQQSTLLLNLSLPTDKDLYAVVKATNRVGLSTRQSSHSFRVDDTPPKVTKSPRFISSEEAPSIYDSSVIHVEWGFDDKESPIKMTLLSLKLQGGAHTELDNIIVKSNGTFVKSLSLKEWLKDGDSYYIAVTSCNMAELCESIKSEPVVFDGTPPIHGHVHGDGTWSNIDSALTLKWENFRDPESGIKSYFITIGKTHSDMEFSRGIVNILHGGDENSTQTGVFNITGLITNGDKIIVSIWARNNANLNGTMRRLTFIAVSNNKNNTGGNLVIEKHSCSVSYCTKECTCAILGGKCLHIRNTLECTQTNNTYMLNNSSIRLRIFGHHSDESTSSTRCLGIEWQSENINVLRYEWSIGIKNMPYGYGIFKTTKEQVWQDVSLQNRVVHCLPWKRQLVHEREYVAYLKTWVSETKYILAQSKPIIIDTTPPGIRRGKFIIDSDTICTHDKKFIKTKNITTCWKSVFSDTQSGVKEYRIMIGVSPGGHEISGIQSVGLATNFSWNFPDLEPGVRYFSSVEAVNFVGQSTTLTSDGITIDSTPPDAGIVFTTKFFHDERWLKEESTISASWEGFSDFESSIDRYILSIIDADQNVIVQDLNVGFLNKYTITDLSLVHGMSYFINVRAVDKAGYSSDISRSEPITLDKTMPEGLKCNKFSEVSIVTTKLLTNEKQVIKDVFRLFNSTMYKIVIDGDVDIKTQNVEIDINGNLYDVALNEHSSEISFMPQTLTSDIGVFVSSPQNQNVSVRITLYKCEILEIDDSKALVVRQISPNFLTIAANVIDKDSGIRNVEMYFGTHLRGQQLKTIKATSPFTNHKVLMPISHRTTLHISVMAENNAGLGKYFYSNSIVWDHTPPKIHIENVSISYIDINGDTLSSITIDLTLEENESEVAYCQCAFGNVVGSQNIQSWKTSRNLYSCQSTLNISHGSNVFPSVQCFNKVGLQTVVNRKSSLVVSFDSPRPVSDEVQSVVNSATVQNSVNIQRVSTSLYFHWQAFRDTSGMAAYKVCIKSDNLIVYDWHSIGTHNYFSADEILLTTMKNYTVLVSGTNVGGRTSDPINGSISVVDIIPIQTGNSCVAYAEKDGKILVSWTDVFNLNFEMDPTFVVYIGSDVGFADLLHHFKTRNTDYWLSSETRLLYVVITAKYVTGSESIYRELIKVED